MIPVYTVSCMELGQYHILSRWFINTGSGHRDWDSSLMVSPVLSQGLLELYLKL
jgi:hypothetical protein